MTRITAEICQFARRAVNFCKIGLNFVIVLEFGVRKVRGYLKGRFYNAMKLVDKVFVENSARESITIEDCGKGRNFYSILYLRSQNLYEALCK